MAIDFVSFGAFALVALAVSIGFTLLLVVLAVLGIRWLLRSLNSQPAAGSSETPDDRALVLLRERFARGEIDADEYEQRRRTLGGR
jgi:putative membrane protein